MNYGGNLLGKKKHSLKIIKKNDKLKFRDLLSVHMQQVTILIEQISIVNSMHIVKKKEKKKSYNKKATHTHKCIIL